MAWLLLCQYMCDSCNFLCQLADLQVVAPCAPLVTRLPRHGSSCTVRRTTHTLLKHRHNKLR